MYKTEFYYKEIETSLKNIAYIVREQEKITEQYRIPSAFLCTKLSKVSNFDTK